MAGYITTQNFVFNGYTVLFFCDKRAQFGPRLFHCCIFWIAHNWTDTPCVTHVNEWSPRRRGCYLNNTQKRQTSMPSARFETAVSKIEQSQTYSLNWCQGNDCTRQNSWNALSSTVVRRWRKGYFNIILSFRFRCSSSRLPSGLSTQMIY